MRFLFVIFVVCVGALIWAAFAMARHIRRHELATDPQHPEPSDDALLTPPAVSLQNAHAKAHRPISGPLNR